MSLDTLVTVVSRAWPSWKRDLKEGDLFCFKGLGHGHQFQIWGFEFGDGSLIHVLSFPW